MEDITYVQDSLIKLIGTKAIHGRHYHLIAFSSIHIFWTLDIFHSNKNGLASKVCPGFTSGLVIFFKPLSLGRTNKLGGGRKPCYIYSRDSCWSLPPMPPIRYFFIMGQKHTIYNFIKSILKGGEMPHLLMLDTPLVT